MIAGIVLAAGQSKRMGRPKMNLAWGETTVIGQVVSTLLQAGLQEIVVVTGGARHEVETSLAGYPVRLVFNPDYEQGEMVSTFQAGLTALGDEIEAALVTLGDQPQIERGVVESVVDAYRRTRASLIIPSYRNRRGHPWLLDRSLWPEGLSLRSPSTLRDFLNDHASQISYLTVETSTVLQDLDTPADYGLYRPE